VVHHNNIREGLIVQLCDIICRRVFLRHIRVMGNEWFEKTDYRLKFEDGGDSWKKLDEIGVGKQRPGTSGVAPWHWHASIQSKIQSSRLIPSVVLHLQKRSLAKILLVECFENEY
jgi:hypothetical protein